MMTAELDVLELAAQEHAFLAASLADPRRHVAGFVGTSRGVVAVLPPCFARDEMHHPPLPDTLSLMRVLRRYRRDDAARRAVREEETGYSRPAPAGGRSLLAVVDAGLELIADFLDHGPLRFQRKVVRQVDRGRIDWARTVNREVALICDGMPVYPQPYHRFLQVDELHPLTQAHAATVADACREMAYENVVVEAGIATRDADVRRIPRILAAERGRVFRDRDHRACQLMAAYWLSRDLTPQSKRAAAFDVTDNFELVWEEMCRSVLGGRRRSVGLDMPPGQYCDIYGHRMGNGLDLRPDIVMTGPGGSPVYILDAKFYTSGGYPGSGDVLKQLAYAHFLSDFWRTAGGGKTDAISCFLFPALWSGGSWARVTGRHVVRGGTGKPMGGDVWLVEVDYRRLAAAYGSRQRLDPNDLYGAVGRARVTGGNPGWR